MNNNYSVFLPFLIPTKSIGNILTEGFVNFIKMVIFLSEYNKVVLKMNVETRLRDAGLRPTKQRAALADLLFAEGDRHVTAEALYDEAVCASVPVSLATIYNTLNQFTEAGLLREVAVQGAKTYFDTNVSDHHHFYLEEENKLMDMEDGKLSVTGLPEVPEGKKISRIDVIVRLSEAD